MRARVRRGLAPRREILAPALGALAILLAGGCGKSGEAATAAVGPSAHSAQSGAVVVSPLPGTPDATAQTQISFLGGEGTRVEDVHVVGSASGSHGGTLKAYSTGTGESFLPSSVFRPGEHVSVSARVAAGPGAGGTVKTSFTVAHAVGVPQKEFAVSKGNPADVQHYASAPSLSPSQVHITTPPRPGSSPGDVFLAPYQGPGRWGPMIVDQHGSLVWFRPLAAGQAATRFGVQTFAGAPALTWWQGRIIQIGFGEGEDVVYNTSYRQVAKVRAGNGLHADLHVFHLTPQGTAWIDAYLPVKMNLSSVGGNRNGVISDSVAEEIDVRTGLVMYEWHALGHVALNESKNPAPRSSYPWDYVHINAISPGTDGDVLISFRNTWSLDDVDLLSGSIRWRLGGKRSSFKLGAGVKFYWQHDAAFQSGGQISLFDNGSTPPEEKQSRGLLIEPNLGTHTVRLERQFTNPSKRLLASSQGNAQPLEGGNWLVGYGGLPNFTEFDPSGHVLLDGTLGRGEQSFTAGLYPWSATPPGAPAIAKAPGHGGGISVAASWNGATAVASWRLLVGTSPTTLQPSTTVPRSGFETTLSSTAAGPYAAVQALDASGNVLGTSPAIST
ncbi:MAG TPA: arylsulfotransferase family protein [Solirubrobacteraceae bacterium]|nr:arylsulfotransferase family protein [Solirubrobacteraceae bacterium]